MKNRKFVVAGFVVALAVPAVLWLRHNGSHAIAAAPRADSDDVAEVRAELADLRQRVAASNRVAVSAVQAAANGHVTPAEPSTSTAPASAPVDKTPGKNTMSDEELRARLSNRFNGEPLDPAWSKPALSLIDGHIHAGLPDGSRVTSMECRRTMCRVESQHSSLNVYTQFVNNALLFPQGGWNGPVMTQIVNPGAEQVVSIAYLMREGEDFTQILEQ